MRYARAPELAVRTSISRSWSRRWLRPLQQADCMCRLQCARGRYRHGWAAAKCPHADVGQAPVRWRITTDCAAAAARPKPCCLQGFDKGSWAPTGMARQARTRARWRCTALGRDAVACRAGVLGRPSGRGRLFCGPRRWLDIAAAHRGKSFAKLTSFSPEVERLRLVSLVNVVVVGAVERLGQWTTTEVRRSVCACPGHASIEQQWRTLSQRLGSA